MLGLTEWLDPDFLIQTFGLVGIGIIVFAESGVLVGLFLPGDSLLFTAGVLAAADKLPFEFLLPVVFVCAVLGDTVGYWFGNKAGPALYRRPDSRFFKQDHLRRAHAFYERRGASTIVIARFIPIVRTLAPIVAGAARMRYRRFLAFNVIGGLLWGVGVSTAGYLLGNAIPSIERYLLPVIALVVLISLIPPMIEVARHRRARRDRATAATPAAPAGDSGDPAPAERH